MAFELQPSGYWYDKVSRGWLQHEPVVVGDIISPITNVLSNVTHGKEYEVTESRKSNSLYITTRINGTYEYIYEQKLIIKDDRGFKKEVRAKNFKKSKGATLMPANVLSIESNKPTVVVEITESLVDGKAVITEIGTPVQLDSLSAARVYTANAITESIREKNTYRQFRVYQEVFVARAKKPEIEFA